MIMYSGLVETRPYEFGAETWILTGPERSKLKLKTRPYQYVDRYFRTQDIHTSMSKKYLLNPLAFPFKRESLPFFLSVSSISKYKTNT